MKLFLEPPPSKPLPDPPCSSFCNPTQNFLRGCPPLCVPFCPSFCQPFPDFLQPPPPHPPSPPSILHTPATNHRHRHHHQDYLSPVFIAMIALLASAFAVVISYLIYSSLRGPPRRRQRSSVPASELEQSSDLLNFHWAWYIASAGLQRSTVESIGLCEYKKGEGLIQGTACVVCLAEFHDGDALRLLPKCCHAFHVPCIDTWFASHTTCPVCRAPVLQPNNNNNNNNNNLQPPRVEPPTSNHPSPSIEVGPAEVEEGATMAPMRRAASMDSLGLEVGGKMNTSAASGSNSLGERSLSCTGKLFSSSRQGLR